MIGTAAGVILGMLLSLVIASAFHLFYGGSLYRYVIYIFLSFGGFALGHLIGYWMSWESLKLGGLYIWPGLVGAWLMLIIGRWLFGANPPDEEE